jgi:hypothetical protein
MRTGHRVVNARIEKVIRKHGAKETVHLFAALVKLGGGGQYQAVTKRIHKIAKSALMIGE